MSIAISGNLATLTFDRFDLDQYRLFLQSKKLPESQTSYDWEHDRYEVTTPARFALLLGVDAPVSAGARLPLPDHLFDYQRWAVEMALDARRFALWLDTGTGKTACYLEWARQVMAITGGRVLLIAPLAVIPQVQEESARFYGDALPIEQLRSRDELADWCQQPGSGLAAINYHKFIGDPMPELRFLAGVVCDESSVLRTGGGVIKWNLIKSCRGIEYKLSCTATPAPNEAMEYASQAAWLEKLRSEGDILWTYFQKDNKTNEWRIKPHGLEAFYRFMASWSLYLRDPAVFGFADILSSIPDPEIIEERIPITDEQRTEMMGVLAATKSGMFADDRLGVVARTKLAQIARGFRYVGGTTRAIDSNKPARVAEIVRNEVAAGRQVLVWTTFNQEEEIVSKLLHDVPTAVLTGAMSEEDRLEVLQAFRRGDVRCVISKPQLIGYGLNLQFVQSMVFSGFDDSFERLYQAVRRAYRFGQTETLRVYLPYVPELEGVVFANLREKEARFLQDVSAQERMYRAALEREVAA